MIEIKIAISDVDYESALDALWPVLVEHFEKSGEKTLASAIISKTKGVSAAAAKAALKILPQETKDELVAMGLTHYREDISGLVMDFAKQRKVSMKVRKIDIKTLPDPKA